MVQLNPSLGSHSHTVNVRAVLHYTPGNGNGQLCDLGFRKTYLCENCGQVASDQAAVRDSDGRPCDVPPVSSLHQLLQVGVGRGFVDESRVQIGGICVKYLQDVSFTLVWLDSSCSIARQPREHKQVRRAAQVRARQQPWGHEEGAGVSLCIGDNSGVPGCQDALVHSKYNVAVCLGAHAGALLMRAAPKRVCLPLTPKTT